MTNSSHTPDEETSYPLELLERLRTAKLYDLEQPRYAGAPTFTPHLPGFVYTLHRRHEADGRQARTSASGMIYTPDHSGTHIDALCHQAYDMQLHQGATITPVVQTPTGFTELGVETIPPILRRGLLLDVARVHGKTCLPERYMVSADDLAEAQHLHGVPIRAGDVVLVRTGNAAHWDNPGRYIDGPGMSTEASKWLAEYQPIAVGADNVAWDVPGYQDPELGTLPGHAILLVRSGIHIIENLNLDELAADNVGESLFICTPLKMRGATGSPIRPLALASIEE